MSGGAVSAATGPARICVTIPQAAGALERFGPLELELSASMRQGALIVTVECARLFGLPLPAALCPQSAAMEYETPQGHFGFDISASLPRIGLLVRYHGHLVRPELDLRR